MAPSWEQPNISETGAELIGQANDLRMVTDLNLPMEHASSSINNLNLRLYKDNLSAYRRMTQAEELPLKVVPDFLQ